MRTTRAQLSKGKTRKMQVTAAELEEIKAIFRENELLEARLSKVYDRIDIGTVDSLVDSALRSYGALRHYLGRVVYVSTGEEFNG